ncbi:endonuclease/exonuclease/phosphatase family protein [uncultured Ilyobacter sp.]|uniref:endonuclease/exonuclease/phosphatase family protein n=1 Tax=uncultured Ilyobacter sp. TaxID=544433 RepID=UPI0029F4E816|nr:endonuclease/exonuclease/phosphatase family protein [uncultured Ilyobacter sp.]
MTIISWNCNMAFRKKIEQVSDIMADIMIISECEELSKFKDEQLNAYPNRYWFGDNNSKDIAIFSKEDYKLHLEESYNENFKYVIPIRVKGVKDFVLFGIWAMNDKEDARNRYISQVGSAIEYYQNLLKEDCIFIGDFNSNTVWDNDSPKKNFTHRDVVEKLKEHNISSVYHKLHDEEYGIESVPTLYMYKHEDKPYHIDYIYCSNVFSEKLKYFSIGEYSNWIKYSDHMPLIIEFL